MRKIIILLLIASFPLWATPSGQKATILGDYVNLRGVPTVNGDVVTVMRKNDRVAIIKRRDQMSQADGKSNYWYKIIHEKSGKQGWVFGSYLGLEIAAGGKNLILDRKIGPVSNSEIRGLAVSVSGAIYVVHQNSLSLSRDGGRIWQTLQPSVLGQRIGTIDSISLSGNSTIALGVKDGDGSGFWISQNNGQSWSRYRSSNGLNSDEVLDVAVLNQSTWLALTDEGPAITVDSGKTWTAVGGDEPGGDALKIAACPGSSTEIGFWITYEDGAAYARRANPASLIQGPGAEEVEDSGKATCSANGDLWAGGDDGVYLVSGPKYRHFESGDVNDLISVGPIVFVATEDGISYSADGGNGWSTFSSQQGLSDDDVSLVAWDSRSQKLYAVADDELFVLSLQ